MDSESGSGLLRFRSARACRACAATRVNLPPVANIRIYSTSGILVNVLSHNQPDGGGEEVWDLLTRGGEEVASGVYFYHIETPEGLTKLGRMTIVNGSSR